MALEISSRSQLDALLTKGGRRTPKTANEKLCPVCQQKRYRVFIKGVERWMGCKCTGIRAHHYV